METNRQEPYSEIEPIRVVEAPESPLPAADRPPKDLSAAESPPPEGSRKKARQDGWMLLLVQSIACVLVVGVALLFKLIGGDTFQQLRDQFAAALRDNSVVSTVMGWLDGGSDETPPPSGATGETPSTTDPSDTDTTDPSGLAAGGRFVQASGTSVKDAPAGASFAPITAVQAAGLPLVEGEVSSLFGYRTDPISGELSFHTGLDIAAPEGAPIAAVYGGTVSLVREDSGYGHYLVVQHDERVSTLYAHCSAILVEEGQTVNAGDTIALVGSTGYSTGNHLHIEVLIDKVAYDPAYVLAVEPYA